MFGFWWVNSSLLEEFSETKMYAALQKLHLKPYMYIWLAIICDNKNNTKQ